MRLYFSFGTVLFLALSSMISSMPSFASTQQFIAYPVQYAPFYLSDGWAGEYPDGYELLEDIFVVGYEDINILGPTQNCNLSKGTVIHPWAKKTQSEFATFNPVMEYVTTQNYSVSYDPEIPLTPGESIFQLAYLSEGVCTLYVRNKVVLGDCLDEYFNEVQLVAASSYKLRKMFRTQCTEGYSLWIDEDELRPYLNNGVKYAELTGFDEVLEP